MLNDELSATGWACDVLQKLCTLLNQRAQSIARATTDLTGSLPVLFASLGYAELINVSLN